MRDPSPAASRRAPLLLALVIGLLVVALLVVNERTDWLELRPASGTATAMALAVDAAPATETARR
ncbi:hypothetical protein F1C10_11740 [Sphingomonas sp. NBWT7]|uniref:hypothetical protein n=1 Tax=Sphingomonas sp. NBWT7 TaxID=2596913 RepID=UPI0016292347|nr:hypothetical protein [Sphingomonas sp. NBWT7]QNE32550.1 hypothetical protein F1C10_11740 [Sphingomonas sp. NBWT7]